jgi:hypothetical protein
MSADAIRLDPQKPQQAAVPSYGPWESRRSHAINA